MLSKNSTLTGLLAGTIFPATAWLLFGRLYPAIVLLHKPAIPYLIALTLNLFVIRFCYSKEADQTGKGVMLATFAWLLVFFYVLKIRLT